MDKRARKILFDTYWSPSGWTRDSTRLSNNDFEYAKAQQAMFDPVKSTHDCAVARARAAAERLSQREAANGFLASLSTRKLEWRSALGSYFVARHLPEHQASPGERQCQVCGLYAGEHEYDLSIFNFERLKWGGVRHSNPMYSALDLELFRNDPPCTPTAEDIGIFRDLVATLRAVPPSVTSAALHKYFPASLKANKPERDQVVAILGLCGVLGTRNHPGFANEYVPWHRRSLPNRHFVDMAYPACWWQGSEGVNAIQLQELFGHAL